MQDTRRREYREVADRVGEDPVREAEMEKIEIKYH
jgi:hypothetical protein